MADTTMLGGLIIIIVVIVIIIEYSLHSRQSIAWKSVSFDYVSAAVNVCVQFRGGMHFGI